jgi:hypothetical protein
MIYYSGKAYKNMRIILIISSVLFFLSCGYDPGQETPRVYLFDFLEDWMLEANELADDLEALDEHYKKFEENEAIVYVNEGDYFSMQAQATESGPRTLISSNADGSFETRRPMWISSDWDRLLISVDRQNWFFASAENPDDHQNIHNKLIFEPQYTPGENEFFVTYSYRADLNDEFEFHWKDRRLPLIDWEIGGIITDSEEDNITMDLRDGALFVPRGTKVNFSLAFIGNMISNENIFTQVSNDGGPKLEAKAMRDIYLHRSGAAGSISFDGEEWGAMFWDFSYEIENSSIVTDLYEVQFRQQVIVEYLPDVETEGQIPREMSRNP